MGEAATGAAGAGFGATGHSGEHVAFGHAAVFARAGHRACGQLVVGHDLGSRRHGHASHGATAGSQCRHGCGSRSSRGGCRGFGTRHSLGVYAGDQLLGGDGAAVGHQQLGQHAGGRGGHFHHHLVGLDLDEDLIHGHGFAGLFLPFQQGGLGHGF
jgi:hypothetical protein